MNVKTKKKFLTYLKSLALSCCVLGSNCASADAAETIEVEINQSEYIEVYSGVARLATANPEIADVSPLADGNFLIVAKKQGVTTVNVWTKEGERVEYQVLVGGAESGVAEMIERKIGLPDVHVTKVGPKIMLQGSVNNQVEKDRAEFIAVMYSDGEDVDLEKTALAKEGDLQEIIFNRKLGRNNVINLLEMRNPYQVNLEVQLLELSSQDADEIGFQWRGGGNNTGVFMAGDGHGGSSFEKRGLLNRWPLSKLDPIDVRIQALVTEGRARVLSRPNISTLSGEVAYVNIGGDVPVPVIGEKGNVGVESKPYGIKLAILPISDSEGNITTQFSATVSDLDYSRAQKISGITVPASRKKETRATLNVPSGMTMAIGGLINTSDNETISKIPLLGDIPIIGELFKHKSKTRENYELMILVTPRLTNESQPVKMSTALKEEYQKGQKINAKREEVDLNAPYVDPEEEARKTAEKMKEKMFVKMTPEARGEQPTTESPAQK